MVAHYFINFIFIKYWDKNLLKGGSKLSSQNNVVNFSNEAALMNKLSEPKTISQLISLLDKLEQFNVLFDTLQQFIGRGSEMADSINRLIVAMRQEIPNTDFFKDLQSSLETMKKLQKLINSEEFKQIEEHLLNEKVLKLLGRVSRAVSEASQEVEKKSSERIGIFTLMQEISNPEIQTSIQFILSFAKILSKELKNA